MRRKSERKNKSPEKKTEAPTRRSHRRRRQKSESSPEPEIEPNVSEEERAPVKITTVIDVEPIKQTSNSNSDEDKTEQPVWQVKTTESPGGDIQKLKICLQRPSSTPERTERSPRRHRKHKRGASHSQTDEELNDSSEEKSYKSKRKTRKSAKSSLTSSGLEESSQESTANAEKSPVHINESKDETYSAVVTEETISENQSAVKHDSQPDVKDNNESIDSEIQPEQALDVNALHSKNVSVKEITNSDNADVNSITITQDDNFSEQAGKKIENEQNIEETPKEDSEKQEIETVTVETKEDSEKQEIETVTTETNEDSEKQEIETVTAEIKEDTEKEEIETVAVDTKENSEKQDIETVTAETKEDTEKEEIETVAVDTKENSEKQDIETVTAETKEDSEKQEKETVIAESKLDSEKQEIDTMTTETNKDSEKQEIETVTTETNKDSEKQEIETVTTETNKDSEKQEIETVTTETNKDSEKQEIETVTAETKEDSEKQEIKTVTAETKEDSEKQETETVTTETKEDSEKQETETVITAETKKDTPEQIVKKTEQSQENLEKGKEKSVELQSDEKMNEVENEGKNDENVKEKSQDKEVIIETKEVEKEDECKNEENEDKNLEEINKDKEVDSKEKEDESKEEENKDKIEDKGNEDKSKDQEDKCKDVENKSKDNAVVEIEQENENAEEKMTVDSESSKKLIEKNYVKAENVSAHKEVTINNKQSKKITRQRKSSESGELTDDSSSTEDLENERKQHNHKTVNKSDKPEIISNAIVKTNSENRSVPVIESSVNSVVMNITTGQENSVVISIPPIDPTRKRKRWKEVSKDLYKVKSKIDVDVLLEICPDIKMLTEEEVKLEHEKSKKVTEEQPPIKKRKTVVEEKKVVAPVEKVVEENNEDKSTINPLLANRKISIISEDTAVQEPLSPPKNPTTAVLYIKNLVRPFTINQLKELLSRTGTIVDKGFWINKIKSECYVQYEIDEQALETRNALHGVHWPVANGRQLIVDFGTVENMEKARIPIEEKKVVETPKPELPELTPKKEEVIDWREEREREKARREQRGTREWDVGKRGRSSSPHHNQKVSPERSPTPEKKMKKKNDVPVKLLDDLFRKTKAIPCIYWLPLSAEQIVIKEEQRRKHMAEHERRMAEIRRAQRDRMRRNSGRGGRGRYD